MAVLFGPLFGPGVADHGDGQGRAEAVVGQHTGGKPPLLPKGA